MQLKLSFKYVAAFLALTFVMHEAHEIAHTTVARIICGSWGHRDFNVWGACDDCEAKHPIVFVSTLAGPLFTFIMLWIGAWMLKKNHTTQRKAWGFSLIFANLPFGRILNPFLGGGDEVYTLRKFIENDNLAWGLGLGGILLCTAYPLYKAFISIENKRRIGWFLLFLILPLAIDLLVVLGLMNTLLEKGIAAKDWILGSPLLVTLWTFLVTLTFILMRKSICTLGKKAADSETTTKI
jgi:hypothetical protein